MHTFQIKMTEDVHERLVHELVNTAAQNDLNVSISGDALIIKRDNVKVSASWKDELLTVQVLDKPMLIPGSYIESKIRDLLQTRMFSMEMPPKKASA